ncbi:MAG: hypothetical protein WDN24_00775 [Sphingomonas sp.]
MAWTMLIAPVAVAAAQGATDVGAGHPLRAVLLDALRPAIAADLGQPVRFVVTKLRVQGDWAFAVVRPQTPAGQWIDFARTHYAERQREGMLDGDTVHALLRREKGAWRVKDFVIGPTDVAWDAWPQQYGVPRGLLFR